MKTPDDNILDRLFREGLNNPDSNAAFRKEDWEAMKELLDEKPRKKKRDCMVLLVFGKCSGHTSFVFRLGIIETSWVN